MLLLKVCLYEKMFVLAEMQCVPAVRGIIGSPVGKAMQPNCPEDLW